MNIKTRLTRCCGKPIGGDNCREGLRCSDCFDKLEGLREIERLKEILKSHGISEKGEHHATAAVVEASARLEKGILEARTEGTKQRGAETK